MWINQKKMWITKQRLKFKAKPMSKPENHAELKE